MYDPYHHSHPEPINLPDSYWSDEGETQPVDPALNDDQQTDIAIIGAGYTGLSAAYHLASHFQKQVVVLEACQVGWGSSGRNAGFVLPSSGRLSRTQLSHRFGDEKAQAISDEFEQSVLLVKQLIEIGKIGCEVVHGGYAKLAHSEKHARLLAKLACLSQGKLRYLGKKALSRELIEADYALGALYNPSAFGLHPLKYCHGMAAICRANQVKIYAQCPVIDWQQAEGKHRLSTPKGSIMAKHVVIASNAYTGPTLFTPLKNRQFPVLSSVLVTDKLSDKQKRSIAMKPGLLVMDTRAMKYYYRILPDGRLLFGGRGAIYGQDADKGKYRQQLLDGLRQTLPQLEGISISYFWSGWVDVSYDDFPRIWQDEKQKISYAMGYCGSGVAFATQAGKRIAEQICAPKQLPNLPFWQSPLPRFPLPILRRPLLWALYQWQKFQ